MIIYFNFSLCFSLKGNMHILRRFWNGWIFFAYNWNIMQAVYIKCFCEVRSGRKMIYNSSTSTFFIHACLFDDPVSVWEVLLSVVCLLFWVLISGAAHPVGCCREGSRCWPHFTRGSLMIMISTPAMLRFVFRLEKRQMILNLFDDDFVLRWGNKQHRLLIEAKLMLVFKDVMTPR